MNQDLFKYIGEALNAGMNISDIRTNLISVGWNTSEIEEAIKIYQGSTAEIPVLGAVKSKFNIKKLYFIGKINFIGAKS